MPKGDYKLIVYTDAMGEEICKAVSENVKGINTLIQENPHWPRATTIKKWRREIPSFASNYARAKAEQADLIAEEILEIADNAEKDFSIVNGKVIANHDHINRARLRIDSRKWYAGKLAPKIYGESRDVKAAEDDMISQFRVEDTTK